MRRPWPVLLSVGFVTQSCGGEGPDSVAERFWEAGQNRDVATLEALSIPSDDVDFNFVERDDAGISHVGVGEVTIRDDVAEVDTSLEIDSTTSGAAPRLRSVSGSVRG